MRSPSLLSGLSNTVLPVVIAVQLVGFFSSSPIALAKEVSPITSQITEVFTQDDFLTLTNTARSEQGVPALHINDELHAAAVAKAYDMAVKGYWDHFRPSDKKAPWDFIKESGYSYTVAGENLARGFRTPGGITAAWLNSPSHRANLLSAKYTEVGFAAVRTFDANGRPVVLTVQMFGSR